jgi:hypothetical protein
VIRSELYLFLALAIGNPEAGPAHEVCSIAGYDAMKEAAKNGFLTKSTVLEGAGTCTVDGQYVVVSPAKPGPGISCKLEFFVGRDLQDPWRVTKISFVGGEYEVVSDLKFPSHRAQVAVRVKSEKQESFSFGPQSITLKGPNCKKDWRNAFAK